MSAYIQSFDEVILGKNHPAVLRVERDGIDETIKASFHNFTTGEYPTRAELRMKKNEIALFLFQYADSEVPEWWKDAEIVWSIG